jgi:ferredoxin
MDKATIKALREAMDKAAETQADRVRLLLDAVDDLRARLATVIEEREVLAAALATLADHDERCSPGCVCCSAVVGEAQEALDAVEPPASATVAAARREADRIERAMAARARAAVLS